MTLSITIKTWHSGITAQDGESCEFFCCYAECHHSECHYAKSHSTGPSVNFIKPVLFGTNSFG